MVLSAWTKESSFSLDPLMKTKWIHRIKKMKATSFDELKIPTKKIAIKPGNVDIIFPISRCQSQIKPPRACFLSYHFLMAFKTSYYLACFPGTSKLCLIQCLGHQICLPLCTRYTIPTNQSPSWPFFPEPLFDYFPFLCFSNVCCVVNNSLNSSLFSNKIKSPSPVFL